MDTERLRSDLHQVHRQESMIRIPAPADDHVMVTDAAPQYVASNRQKVTDADKKQLQP